MNNFNSIKRFQKKKNNQTNHADSCLFILIECHGPCHLHKAAFDFMAFAIYNLGAYTVIHFYLMGNVKLDVGVVYMMGSIRSKEI